MKLWSDSISIIDINLSIKKFHGILSRMACSPTAHLRALKPDLGLIWHKIKWIYEKNYELVAEL